ATGFPIIASGCHAELMRPGLFRGAGPRPFPAVWGACGNEVGAGAQAAVECEWSGRAGGGSRISTFRTVLDPFEVAAIGASGATQGRELSSITDFPTTGDDIRRRRLACHREGSGADPSRGHADGRWIGRLHCAVRHDAAQ